MKREKFLEDIAIGMVAENFVLNFMRRVYPSASKVHEYFGYDIWVPELHQSVEVKADLMSNETGCFFIEVEFNGKPSGLANTTADYWMIWDSNRLVMIIPFHLRQLIKTLQLEKREFAPNDATKARKAFLVPKAKVIEKGTTIWEKK